MPDLDWTLSVPLRRSWAEVCRWITSLAGGSSGRGNVGWLDVAPSIQLSLRLKRHLKWCATAICVVITILSVSARRSVELDDDKVVSEYEEDWPEGGIGFAIRVSCPSSLGPSWQFRQMVKFLNFKIQLTLCLYHLFRKFSKIRSWYSHLKSPKLSFSNFFNIIFLGEGR